MTSRHLLDRLQAEVAKVEQETMARVEQQPAAAEALRQADADRESEWLAHVERLQGSRRDVQAAQQRAARLVEETEHNLATLEQSLRAWLATAAGLKSKPGADQASKR